jgi:hypothetical protein
MARRRKLAYGNLCCLFIFLLCAIALGLTLGLVYGLADQPIPTTTTTQSTTTAPLTTTTTATTTTIVTTTTTATTTVPPTTTPAPIPCNIIGDTFSSGTLDPAWNTSYSSNTGSYVPIVQNGTAFLGPITTGNISMFQTFTLTSNTSLGFYYNGDSWDSLPWDSQNIYITDVTGATILYTLLSQCTADTTWINFYCVNVYGPPCNFSPSLNGTTVGLMFVTHQDGDANFTNLYVDNVCVGDNNLFPAPGPVTTATPYCKSYRSTLNLGQSLPIYTDDLTLKNFDTKTNGGNFTSTPATYKLRNTYTNIGGGNGALQSNCDLIQIIFNTTNNGTIFNTYNTTYLISSIPAYIVYSNFSSGGDNEVDPFYHPNGTLFISVNTLGGYAVLMVFNPTTSIFSLVSAPGDIPLPPIFGILRASLAILNNVAYMDLPPGLTYMYNLGTNGPMTLVYNHSVTMPTNYYETNQAFVYYRNGEQHLGYSIIRSNGAPIIYFLNTTTFTPYALFPVSPSYIGGLAQATWSVG